PPTIESLKLRADVQIASKKWDDSIVTLQQALTLAPNDAQLHGGLGRIFLQKRDFAAAEKELRIALRLDGKNLAYWKDLSSAFFLSGNYPAALSTLDEIAKMEQQGAGVWFVRAICYDKLNQPKLALEAYQKFLALDQDKNPDQARQTSGKTTKQAWARSAKRSQSREQTRHPRPVGPTSLAHAALTAPRANEHSHKI